MQSEPFHCPVDKPRVKVAVDIGCGSRAMTLNLAERFPSAIVYGVDISPPPAHAQERAKKLGNIAWIPGNIFHLIGQHPQLQVESADFVYSNML